MREKIFISPAKYVQGRGLLNKSAEYLMDAFGNKFMVIADEIAMKYAGDKVCASLRKAGADVEVVNFRGQSSLAEIERIVEIGRKRDYDAVVAIGGGKTDDTARGVKQELGLGLAIIPTIASTDAPTASLYAIYSEQDKVLEYRYTRNADLILMDTEVICNAPAQFLAFGIADALATWLEASACAKSDSCTTTGGRPTLAGLAIAEKCEEIIFQYGVQAYQANQAHVVTKAFDYVVEANTLLSGIGYESGGLAAAHSVHNALTMLSGEIEKTSHGEKVAYGTLVQLFLENRTREEIDKFVKFYRELELPTTLAQLGIEGIGRDELLQVGEAATAQGETIHNMPFEVTAKDVVDAIIAVDAYSKSKI